MLGRMPIVVGLVGVPVTPAAFFNQPQGVTPAHHRYLSARNADLLQFFDQHQRQRQSSDNLPPMNSEQAEQLEPNGLNETPLEASHQEPQQEELPEEEEEEAAHFPSRSTSDADENEEDG